MSEHLRFHTELRKLRGIVRRGAERYFWRERGYGNQCCSNAHASDQRSDWAGEPPIESDQDELEFDDGRLTRGANAARVRAGSCHSNW